MPTAVAAERGHAPDVASLRVLLLQVRDHRQAELQERECFVGLSGLAPDRFRYHNLFERPELTYADARAADLVVIGGAGAHSVTEQHSFSRPLAAFVERWVGDGRPLFGSCFGHQFLAQALGGRVETDLARKELGTLDVELTDAGAADPLFAATPRRFAAQFGHNDRVVELPRGGVDLAFTELCPTQAFRIADRPVWGCQFHVELDPDRMVQRASIYRGGYLPDEGALERLRASLRPSPDASRLFARFLTLAAGAIAAR
jgi:GMP synthase (glutamine-hydrolysing)